MRSLWQNGVSEAPASWKTIWGRRPPGRSTVPEVAFSRPAITRSSVDFPDPLSPTSATDSPCPTRSDTPRSACNLP